MIKLDSTIYLDMKTRLDIVSSIIDTHLQQHTVAKIHPEIKDHIESAYNALYLTGLKLKEIENEEYVK